uniref:Uncharacterized protein n=1 Tax=Magallana gigas TaxID=29159 RepID=A0A8W8JEL4_MAGGI
MSKLYFMVSVSFATISLALKMCPESISTVSTVNRCPSNVAEWESAAKKKSCNDLGQLQSCTAADDFVYHCVLNKDATMLLENQLQRDPAHLERLGYEGARTRLKVDAVSDVPLLIHAKENNGAVRLVLPAKPRGAYAKRQKAEIFRQAFQELEPRLSENNTLPDHSIDLIEPGDPNDEHLIEPTASTNAIPETQSKKCQATLQVPQRTRRIQVSLDKKNMQHAVENVEDNDDDSDIEGGDIEGSDEDPDFDLDSEYPESDSSDEEDEEFQLSTDITPEEERQFLVSEVQLAKLLQNCSVCGSACHTVVNGVCGTMISTSSVFPNGHSSTWESQKCHHGMPWANVLVAGAIVFSGANASKSLILFRHLNLQMMSISTFSRLQASYVVPASIFTWDFHQHTLLAEYQGRSLTLGGDARCDSPGFTAKFGSYTLMELSSGKILDFQVNTHGVGGLKHLDDAGLHIENPVTDRHCMIKKYMREDHQDKNHFFDVWHVAKASKKRDCGNIRPWIKSSVNHCYLVAASCGEDSELKVQKWSSLIRHVSNQHEHCEHELLNEERLWLKEGSKAHKLFREVVESRYLTRDVGKLSPLHQTYGLEMYHSVVNSFAPKNTHFFYPAIMARLCVSALHFNENGQRHQATTKDGVARWQISYPKGKKGTQAVVKPNKTAVTFDYVDILRINLCERRRQHPSYTQSNDDAHMSLGYCPPALTLGFEGFVKEDLIATRRSKFSH